jgi:hypothetical protein
MASRGSEARAWTSLHWAESMMLAHPPPRAGARRGGGGRADGGDYQIGRALITQDSATPSFLQSVA